MSKQDYTNGLSYKLFFWMFFLYGVISFGFRISELTYDSKELIDVDTNGHIKDIKLLDVERVRGCYFWDQQIMKIKRLSNVCKPDGELSNILDCTSSTYKVGGFQYIFLNKEDLLKSANNMKQSCEKHIKPSKWQIFINIMF